MKQRYFVKFVVENFGGLLEFFSHHYISASTDAKTVALQKLRRDSKED
jgi:hypothetical protein